jgi:hypothetical protein
VEHYSQIGTQIPVDIETQKIFINRKREKIGIYSKQKIPVQNLHGDFCLEGCWHLASGNWLLNLKKNQLHFSN